MQFDDVIKTCLAFAIDNGGTIATYPVGHAKLQVHSRTTRTEILVDHTESEWQVVQLQNEAGDDTSAKETASTKEDLLKCLSNFWDNPINTRPSLPR
jgi:hypothetical protein